MFAISRRVLAVCPRPVAALVGFGRVGAWLWGKGTDAQHYGPVASQQQAHTAG